MNRVITLKRFIIRSLVLYLLLSQISSASVTINEMERCNKIAVAILSACLADNTVTPSECWVKSESAYKECRTKVFERHQYPTERQIEQEKREHQLR